MVSASVVWTAVKVVAALTALVIGAVCVVVCYRDERAKEKRDGVCPHFDTGDCVYVEPKTGMPLICPCSPNCCNCNAVTRNALEEVRNG